MTSLGREPAKMISFKRRVVFILRQPGSSVPSKTKYSIGFYTDPNPRVLDPISSKPELHHESREGNLKSAETFNAQFGII